MATLCLILWRRLGYTRTVVESLSQCLGIENYKLNIFIDYGYREVSEFIKQYNFPCETYVTIHKRRLGSNANTLCALEHSFRDDDFVIVLEDDIVPALDCLRYFEFCDEVFRLDKSVFSATSYSKGKCEVRYNYSVRRQHWYTPWGWATWVDRWQEMARGWQAGRQPGWDGRINKMRGARVEVQPHLARTQNIGAENGTWCPGPEWHRENQYNEYGAWSIEINPSVTFVQVDNPDRHC